MVGAGPGGIAAAATAAEVGVTTCLLDDNWSPGGQIWRGLSSQNSQNNPHGREFAKWTQRLRHSNCQVWSGWQVIDAPGPQTLRVSRGVELCDIAYDKLILATGARERFLPFPGWTLPGVAGAGGLQALVKSGLDVSGMYIVVAGTGPLVLAVSAGLADAGAKIVAIYEQAPMKNLIAFSLSLVGFPGKIGEGAGYLRKLRGIPYRTGCWVKRADGVSRLGQITVTNGTSEWTQRCDWLACGFHLVPNLELPILVGCAIVNGYVAVDDLQQSSMPGIACVGELTGIGGLEKALLEGEIAAWVATGRERQAREQMRRANRLRNFARRMDRAFVLREELRRVPAADTVVCRCEDVTHSMMQASCSWREAKLHTRCGMGACQGRVCGPQAEFLFGWKYEGFRPPVFPTKLSSLAERVDPRKEDSTEHAI